jgi:hypothetical protein
MSTWFKLSKNSKVERLTQIFRRSPKATDPNDQIPAPNQVTKLTIWRRMNDYVRTIINDYKEVGKDTVRHMGENPFKSTAYGVGMLVTLLAYKRNPTHIDYIDERRRYTADLIMCGSTYNRCFEAYLNELNKLEYTNRLNYRSCVLFSLILADDIDEQSTTYEKNCAQLRNPNKYNVFNQLNRLLAFLSRVVDIGYFGKWRYLSKNSIDFDIDDNEWKKFDINK